jgi:Ca2+-binding EF-hand superfamily protein
MPGMSAQTWSLQELEKMWLQYDNNNSGQISFAEIEEVVVEQYPEFDNKEVIHHFRNA